MQTVRAWHTHLGMFLAPSIIFFAITGGLQLFSLHEAHGSYTPPAFVEKLSALHKDQVFQHKAHETAPVDKEGAAAEVAPADAQEEEPATPLAALVLKWLFLIVAIGLTASTLLGVWMGLKGTVRRPRYLAILGIGAVLPTVIAFLGTLK